MKVLAISTALFNTSVALLEKKGEEYVLLEEKCWKSNRNEAENLLNEAKNLLEKNSLSLSDVEEVFTVSGPGSFTGLRVGLVTVNTIAYLNKCPVKEVNTFEYLWNGVGEQSDESGLLLFAGSKGVYFHKSKDTAVEEIEILNIDDVSEILKKNNISKIFGEISTEQQEKLSEFEIEEINQSFGRVSEKILNTGQAREVKQVRPLYIKKPQITESKK
ncbi:tRNA (adenosine(37)-N6)-threonylcarbamoyltransferase complex dimerization subunit type 1 TsaB [Candidatus Peregrinibacteria bacterium]|nr:tRNA (adenosine(37)-N6)-threonylcarbamoyltransferase complex dimerization subunit type 1 TsaB [Candidatus Peregrinibacteria bacterium]